MLAVLEPLGMPLTTLVVPGNAADDPSYEPGDHPRWPSRGTRGALVHRRQQDGRFADSGFYRPEEYEQRYPEEQTFAYLSVHPIGGTPITT